MSLLDYLRRPEFLPPPRFGYGPAARAIIFLRTCLIFQLCMVIGDTLLSWCVPAWIVPTRLVLVTQPRSGSTLLLAALARDPRVWCKGEILNGAFLRYGDIHYASEWRRELHIRATFALLPAIFYNAWRILLAWVLGLFRSGRRELPSRGLPLVEMVVIKVFLDHVIPDEPSIRRWNECSESAVVVSFERLIGMFNNPAILCLYRSCLLSTYVSLQAALRTTHGLPKQNAKSIAYAMPACWLMWKIRSLRCSATNGVA